MGVLAPLASLVGQGVVINEIHFRPVGGRDFEFVELLNASPGRVDVSGWRFQRGIDLTIPDNTSIAAGDYLVAARNLAAFSTQFPGVPANRVIGGYEGSLDNDGETLRIVDANGVIRDQVRYGAPFPWPAAANGNGASLERLCATSSGDSAQNWSADAARGPSPGARNGVVQCPPPAYVAPAVVINEIHYHPSEGDALQYVELYNTRTTAVDVSGWSFTDGLDFVMPAGTTIPGGGLLVVAADAARVRARYGITNVVGNFLGTLADGGERIELSDAMLLPVDVVKYSDAGSWPETADGLGFSIEKVDPAADGIDPASWRSAIGGGRSAGFREVTVTGTATSSELQVYLEADGELLVDDVSLTPEGDPAAEVIPGGDFALGAGDWTALGNHGNSRWQPDGGVDDSACLRVIASDPGDGAASAIVHVTSPALVMGARYRLRLSLKPLWGSVTTIVRLAGSTAQTGVFERVDFTDVFLSPGKPNTVRNSPVPPFVIRITNSIDQPTSTDRVTVTCFVKASAEVTDVELNYRAGDTAGFVLMQDDGLSGDGLPGDGVYGARMPTFPSATIVRYTITAFDAEGGVATFPDGNEPTGSFAFYVDDNRPQTTVPIYYFLGADLNALDCDDYITAQFVRKDDVFLNIGVRNRGDCSLPKRSIRVCFNRTREFRGHRKINLNSLWSDKSLVREKLSWDILDDLREPRSEAFHVRVHRDGDYHGLFLFLENPDRNYLRSNDLDASGNLYNSASGTEEPLASPAAYREAYRKTTNDDGDFTDLIDFITQLGSQSAAQLLTWLHANVDVEAELDYQASVVAIAGPDHLAKNHYLHHDPVTGLWRRLLWDVDLTHGRFNDPANGGAFNDIVAPGMVDLFYGEGVNGLTTRFFGASSGGGARYFDRVLAGRVWSHLREKTGGPSFRRRVEDLRELLRLEAADDRARWGRFPGRPAPDHPADFDSNLDQLLGAGAFAEDGYLGRRIAFLRAELARVGLDSFPWVRITEIMYNPFGVPELEFVELHNTETRSVDVSGWHLQPVGFTFPAGTTLAGGETVVVSRDPAVLRQTHTSMAARLFGPYTGRLRNGGDTVRLLDGTPGSGVTFPARHPLTIDVVVYEDGGDWPSSPDGTGPSLELRNVGIDNDLPGSWRASVAGGSPGRLESENLPPFIDLVVAPREGVAPLEVQLDASGSIDPDGDALTASWDLGDGTQRNGTRLTHVYRDSGVFEGLVTLDDGKSTPVSRGFRITVLANTPPILALSVAPTEGDAPLDVTLDASGSSDPDGDSFTVEWVLGDGATASGPVVSHRYLAPGVYTGSVTLDDGASPPVVREFTIVVRDGGGDTVFLRGDVNNDGRVDLSDSIWALEWQFRGGPAPPCLAAGDANGDGGTDISDAIFILLFLFQGGRPVPPPYPECGLAPAGTDLPCPVTRCGG